MTKPILPDAFDNKSIKALFDNPNRFLINNENLNFPFPCYFVGGRLENIRDAILPSLRKELGMNLVMIGHKDPTKKSFPIMPFTTCLVFHLKDMSSHAIREWAKKETDDMGILFVEIVQKIKPTLETIQKHYPNFWEISQRFKILRSLLPPEDCKQEDEFLVLTVENFVKDITQKEDWLLIEKACMDKPYALLPVNSHNEDPLSFYRKKIRENINNFISDIEVQAQKRSESSSHPRMEDWYQQGAVLLADHVLSVIQGKTNRYNKECLLNVKRLWLIDMITDPNLSKEWTSNFHKVDLAFKRAFGCGIPSVLKNEVLSMIEMKYQDEYKNLSIEEEPEEKPEEEPEEEPEEIVSLDETKKEEDEAMIKITNAAPTVDNQKLKIAGINGMRFQMTEGATLVIENIEITNLDLKECSQVSIKNVNGNLVGELKITF